MIYRNYTQEQREDRFTKPSRFCNKPHRWHSADSDSTEYEVLECVAGLVRALQPEIVVETGTAFGYGSQAIGLALEANGHGKLYSLEIDHYRVAQARERIHGLPVEIVLCDSTTWIPPGDIEFAFFDSALNERATEFRGLRRHIPVGSIVAFHDAAPHHPLYPDLQKLEREELLRMIRLRTPRGLVLAEVL